MNLTTAYMDNLGNEQAARTRALDLLHGALFRGRMIAQERLDQGAEGLDTARLLGAVADEVIAALYDYTRTHVFRAHNPTLAERMSICASGGYGRGVLAPSSDIDLLFLRPYKASAHAESVIEYMLYALWDMGLKVGHAFRSPEDCVRLAREDVSIKTSLLDMRLIAGDADLFGDVTARFQKDCVTGRDAQFIADKLAERDARHARQGDSRYVVEPNVKEGKGGLRDLQTLYWIVKHMHGGVTLEDVMGHSVLTGHEYHVFIRAARFLWTVRCQLHFITGRAEERLNFDLQPEIAARLGYRDRGDQLGVERFMKRYFLVARDVGGLTRILAAKLEAQQKKTPEGVRRFLPVRPPKPIDETDFVVDGGRVSVQDRARLIDKPVNMLRIFTVADRLGLDIHPNALSVITRQLRAFTPDMRESDEAREAFFDALLETGQPGETLRRMNEAGILGRFLPEFGGIVAQTQFNMYHHYTVDEHTLRAVDTIAEIERGESSRHPLASEIFRILSHRRALYLAMLLHDTGKGRGDQQVEGAKTAAAACRRLGLPPAEVDLVAWLVGHHLVMSETAQTRDIGDPRTVARFAGEVGSLDRLRLLYILTVADICAVGPNVWNAWKGQLLADLYRNTAAALRGGRADERGVQAVLEARAESRRETLVDRIGALPQLMLSLEPAYWTGFEPGDLAWHARLLEEAPAAPIVRAEPREDGGAVVVFVSGPDRVGLFADLAGVMASEGANIVQAQVFTSRDGTVLDVFVLQNERGEAFAGGERDRLDRLEAGIRSALMGSGGVGQIRSPLNRRHAAFLIEPLVEVRNDLSAEHTVIEVTARDRLALLHDVAQSLAAEGLSLTSAHVGSYGERVFDAFYVQSGEGGKLTDPEAIARLEAALFEVVRRGEPDAPSTPARTLKRAAAVDRF